MNSYQDPMDPQSATMGSNRFSILLPGFEGQVVTVDELRALAMGKAIHPSTQVQPEGQGYVMMANDVPGVYSSKSWLVALILSIIVGGLGVDRFYLGRPGLGILKLLSNVTIIGGLVWWIVDIIMIANRTIQTGDGLPLGN